LLNESAASCSASVRLTPPSSNGKLAFGSESLVRILFVTQWFDPEPMFKGLPFARELARQGHHVQVLTGFPNYPGGRLYQGYRIRLLQRERIDGIEVMRVPLYPSHSHSVIGRIANYLSFAIAATVIGPAVVKRPDVIYVYHPPATVAIPALWLRTLFSARLVYDIQDLWPDTVLATGMLRGSMLMRLLAKWCDFVYANADHLTVLSHGFKAALIARGVPADKISVIYNWCDEKQLFEGGEPQTPACFQELKDRFLVVFAGNMGSAQSLDSVLETANLLRERRPDVAFVFIGGGTKVERLTREAERLRLTNVTFIPRVPVADMAPILRRADALLVHLKDDPLFQITIPSKTQAYMAAGRPIVMAVRGDAQAMVAEADCGITCAPGQPDQLAKAIEKLAGLSGRERQALGENGRRFYQQKLALPVGSKKFEALFRRLCGSQPDTSVGH
jgi:colanic acid biosynthesis glycosyl transferase WcaI